MLANLFRRARGVLPRQLAVARTPVVATQRTNENVIPGNVFGVRHFSKIKKISKTDREAGRLWRERQRCIEEGEEPEEEEEVVEEKKEFSIDDFRKNVMRCAEGMKIQLADVTNDRLHPEMFEEITAQIGERTATQTRKVGRQIPFEPIGDHAIVSVESNSLVIVELFEPEHGERVRHAIQKKNRKWQVTVQDGVVKVNIPKADSESKEELKNSAKKIYNEQKDRIKFAREKARKQVKKLIASDNCQKQAETAIQKIVDDAHKQMDQMLKVKENSLKNL